MEPRQLASRVGRFAFTALAIAFLGVSSRILRSVVEHNTGLGDPQALPERPRRIAEWLCHISTALLFLGIGLVFARRFTAILAIVLAILLAAVAGRYLGRTVWGLPNAFHEPAGRWGEVVRRLVRVIRHGHP